MTATILGACLLVWQYPGHQIGLSKQGEADAPNLAHLILSTKVQERQDAYRYAMANMIGQKREKSKPFLLRIIHENPLITPNNGPPENEEDRYAPRRIALSILAEWHDPDLISVFIENIDYVAEDPNRSGLSNVPIGNEPFAAVKGLINIGKPAMQPCLKELAKNENNPEVVRFRPRTPDDYRLSLYRRDNLLFVLKSILGNQETRSQLDKESRRLEKIDQHGAENLRAAAKSPLINGQ